MLFLSAKSMSGNVDAISASTWKHWVIAAVINLILFGFGALAAGLQ